MTGTRPRSAKCILLSPSGEPAQGIALIGLYSQQRPAPSNSTTLRRRTYPDGAVIDYDHAIHMLTATLPEGGKVKLIAPDGVSIIGNVDIKGLLRASEDVIAGDISLVNHRTKGVTPGNGVSEEPTP